MGFKPVDHRFGAVLFGILFAYLIVGVAMYATPETPEYHMAFIGSILWVLGKFSAEKGIGDKKGLRFDYLKYTDAEWDNLAVNVVGIFIFVPQMHNIAGLQSRIEYSDLWYYGAGILSDGLYIGVVFVAKLKKKYEGDALPELPDLNQPTNQD
jgi:hypothetical protein